jgi:hypothetical protein
MPVERETEESISKNSPGSMGDARPNKGFIFSLLTKKLLNSHVLTESTFNLTHLLKG